MAYIAKSIHYENWKLRDGPHEFNYYGHGANGMLFLSRRHSRIRKVPFGGGSEPSEKLVRVAEDELKAVMLAARSCWTRRYLPLPIKEVPSSRVYDQKNSDISDTFFLTRLSFEMGFVEIEGAVEMKFQTAGSWHSKTIRRRFEKIGIFHLIDATVWQGSDGGIFKIVDFGVDPRVHDQ